MGENEKMAGGQGQAVTEVTAGAEMPETVRADAADIADAVSFPELALFLAKSYGTMLKDQEHLKAVIDAGIQPYTKEQAIRDLSAIRIDYESERVQTSNISNAPERIAVLLDNGYVEKMNRRLRYEYGQTVKDYDYLSWKIEVAETAMQERMDKKERAIFERLYVRGYTFSQLKKAYKKKLCNRQICEIKKAILTALEDEIALRAGSRKTEPEYLERLRCEAVAEREEYGNG